MKIAVITAMPEEYRAVAVSLGAAAAASAGTLRGGRFTLGGDEFLLVESGMGFDNAARAAETLVRDERPDLLVSAGFCGAVDPGLRAGDVVVAKHIVIANDCGFEEIPVELSCIGPAFVERQEGEGKRVVAGTFVGTAAITSKSHLAGMLPGHYPTPVVEMESGAIAAIAAKNGILLLAIRAVSDPADEELGFSLDELCDAGMRRILLHRVLLTILRKPRIMPQLVRLAFSSRRAAEGLSSALSRLFATL